MKIFLRFLFVLSLVWMIARGAIYLLPGDPVDYLIQESLIQTDSEITISKIREKMDLNQDLLQRMTSLPKNESLLVDTPVSKLILKSLKNSAVLTLLTLLFTLFFSISLLYLGHYSETWQRFAQTLSIFLASIPIFISGPILLFLFSLKWNLFPVTKNPVLPSLCLSLYLSGFWFRTLNDQIRLYLPRSAAQGARSRGLEEWKVFLYYILFPCAGGFIRFFASQMGNLLNGSLIVELIFQWPGLGLLLADSVNQRDYPVMEMGLMLVSLITLLSLHLGKWLQLRLEPKQS